MKHLKVQYNRTDKATFKRTHPHNTSHTHTHTIPTPKHGQNSKDKEQHFPQTVNIKIYSLKKIKKNRNMQLYISYFMKPGRGLVGPFFH